jgi:hypothetical protein
MNPPVPFAASIGGKLTNGSAALFFILMAQCAFKPEPQDFSLFFIVMVSIVVCGFVNATSLSLEDYPRESLLIVLAGPFISGPLLAWTHWTGGGTQWPAFPLGVIALVFAYFVVKPPNWRITKLA